MKLECPNCGSEYPDLPIDVTEHQARLALRAVMLWYGESPIREIQMANAVCGMHFPVREIEAALSSAVQHASDCAVHNAPALPVGPCDCGAVPE